jgi:uncharacterized membrane protein (UPF0182 family)
VVPIDQSLLYVQPVYVESSANQIPTLKDVVVVYNHTAYQSSNASLDNALCQIQNPAPDNSRPFASYCSTPQAKGAPLVGGGPTVIPSPTGGTGSGTTTVPPNSPAPTTVSGLLAKAQAAFAAANTALKNGNLALYQTDIQQGVNYVNQAQALAGRK